MASDQHLTKLGSVLSRGLEQAQQAAPQAVDAAARDRFVRAAAAEPRRRRARALSGIALAAVIAGLALWSLSARTLSFQIASRAGQAGQWIDATRPEALSFSDGSRVQLHSGARLRVDRLAPRGASVTLEAGRLDADIHHRVGTNWEVHAGPFIVRVRGTRFRVDWQAEAGRFRLDLLEGSVAVEDPVRGESHVLEAPRVLEIDTRGRGSISKAPPAKVEAPVLPSAVAPDDRERQAAPNAAAATSAVRAREPSWRELARDARHGEALAAAESEGFSELCARLPASELLKLADVARLGGDGKRAAEALSRLRQRFPGTPDAALAAYSLGTLAFRSPSGAARWFSTYLNEAPAGALAREALGRLIECEDDLGNRVQARDLARRYLAKYPSGPHADVARRIVSQSR